MIAIHTLIYVVTSFTVGILLIGLSTGFFTLGQFTQFIIGNIFSSPLQKALWGWGGLVILLSALSFLLKLFGTARREKFVTRSTEDGDVSITLSAIEDMIKKVVEDKKELSHVKPKVTFTRKGMNILIKGSLTEEVNLIQFTADMQEVVKKKLTHLLGKDEHLHINLQIKKLAFTASKDIVEEEPRVPFRNY